MEMSPLPKYKLVFLGDESVGKTSIITNVIYDNFDTTYKPTIGLDIISKTFYGEDRTVRLQLWDAAGQSRFRTLIPSYVKDSLAAVIVFDVTNRQSFLNIATWIEEVCKVKGTDVIIVLVGNKMELIDKRQVSMDEGYYKARELGFMYMETSARIGFNTKPLFRKIVVALSAMDPHSHTKEEDMVDVNLQSSSNVSSMPIGTSLQRLLDENNMVGLDMVSSSFTSNTQEFTHDEENIKEKFNDEEKGCKDMEDKRDWSDMLKRKRDMLESNRRVEEKVQEYGNVYDERYDDMLKRMEVMQNGIRRVEEMVKECRKVCNETCEDMLKMMEDILKI